MSTDSSESEDSHDDVGQSPTNGERRVVLQKYDGESWTHVRVLNEASPEDGSPAARQATDVMDELEDL